MDDGRRGVLFRYTLRQMRLLLGTANAGKIHELREALHGLPVDLLTPDALGIDDTPEEHADTFADNAALKARFYHELGGMSTIADDSGILVDALPGELGVHTRRWGAGAGASDEEWIRLFLDRMSHHDNRRARFECVLCCMDDAGREHFFTGVTHGTITRDVEADYLPGLPVSACFRPDGCDRVYSALSVEEKNRVSHRGKAAVALREFLAHIPSSGSART